MNFRRYLLPVVSIIMMVAGIIVALTILFMESSLTRDVVIYYACASASMSGVISFNMFTEASNIVYLRRYIWVRKMKRAGMAMGCSIAVLLVAVLSTNASFSFSETMALLIAIGILTICYYRPMFIEALKSR